MYDCFSVFIPKFVRKECYQGARWLKQGTVIPSRLDSPPPSGWSALPMGRRAEGEAAAPVPRTDCTVGSVMINYEVCGLTVHIDNSSGVADAETVRNQ